MSSRQGVGPLTLQNKGSPQHRRRCGVQGSPLLSAPGWIVPHISLLTAHLVAAEDSDLLMVIKGLDDPLTCHGFLESQGLL